MCAISPNLDISLQHLLSDLGNSRQKSFGGSQSSLVHCQCSQHCPGELYQCQHQNEHNWRLLHLLEWILPQMKVDAWHHQQGLPTLSRIKCWFRSYKWLIWVLLVQLQGNKLQFAGGGGWGMVKEIGVTVNKIQDCSWVVLHASQNMYHVNFTFSTKAHYCILHQ